MTQQPLYHKIQSVFKRDPDNHYKTFLMGEYADPSFEYLAEMPWELTEKIDGTNTRIHVHGDGSVIGGRTERADLHRDLEAHLTDVMHRAERLELGGLTLYGEGYGAGIQKVVTKLKTADLPSRGQ